MHDINSYSINIFISGISKKMIFFFLYTFNNNINQTRCCTNFSIPISILKYLKILREKFTKISSKISYQKKKKKMLDTNYSHLRLQIIAFTKQKTKRLNKRVFERRCNFSSNCKRSWKILDSNSLSFFQNFKIRHNLSQQSLGSII